MQQEESLDNLMNQCPFSLELWYKVAIIMRKMDRLEDRIIQSIEWWRMDSYKNPILNRIW